MPEGRPPVLVLDDVRPEDRGRVGGKAAALAALRGAGLPVPDGFVLLADAGPGWREALRAAYARLGGRVAVRSSGTAEDLEAASFAGQYETVLDVAGADAVLAAAERCLDSAPRVEAYAFALGAPRGALALLVQRFVEPRAAGVAFTRHPEFDDVLLLEAHAGRGEALVSGRVKPVAYLVDRTTRVALEPVPSLLSPAELRRLVDLALHAEALFGAPQDVEWAMGPEGAVLLQSRPITVAAGSELPQSARRLTRANVGEVLPGPIAPLTWTSVVGFLERGFQAVARRASLLPAGLDGPFLVRYRARVYLNLSLCLEVAARLPGVTVRDAERLVLGQASATTGGSRLPPVAALPRLLGVGLRLVAMASRLPAELEASERRVRALPDAARVANASWESLPELWREFVGAGEEIARAHIGASGACGFRLALLQGLLSHVPGDPVDLTNRLLSGLDDVESVRPTLALEALAADLRGREDAQLFRDGGGAPPADLAARFDAFFAEFGHRAVSEADLASPAWEDDRAPVLDALRTLAKDARPAGFGHAAREAARAADLEAVAHFFGPVGGALIRAFLDGAGAAVATRERTKSLAVRVVAHGRRLAAVTARQLVARGMLAATEDIHFLELRELVAAFAGTPVPPALLARRKRAHERESRLDAPREVDRDATQRADTGAEGWTGTGVSAGVGAGPVRILRPGERARLEPGEVLVAPVLDAALGPLLLSAAGAVVEIGGMLSHGAVVARELGVPCVVDVAGATARLRDGQRVLVDGSAGRVEVLEERGTTPEAERGAATLEAADPADERLHAFDADPLARESVYFNLQDPQAGVALVASQGVRPGGRGEAVLTLLMPDGRVLWALDIEAPRVTATGFGVGGLETLWAPIRLRYTGRMASCEASAFPLGPLPLLMAPRVHEVDLDLTLEPTTPALDLVQALDPDARRAFVPLGRHHVEQSGVFRGPLRVDGRAHALEATGSRDHSWGLRDWSAADHWRLFTARLGDDFAFHALTASCRGRRAAGGFVWDGKRAWALQRVEHSAERRSDALSGFDLELRTRDGRRFRLRGDVVRRVTIPVQFERRPLSLLARGPFALRLHENFTRYRLGDLSGHGIAEFTERTL